MDEVVASWPVERRERVKKRSTELIAKVNALNELRESQKITQQKMAQLLNIDQSGVSRLENRKDFKLSTLRHYIEALGGEVKVTIKFPDLPEIELTNLPEGSI